MLRSEYSIQSKINQMPQRTKLVKAGSWRTLESYWNATGTAFFLNPINLKVRVRYGGNSWWNGFSRQEKTLNGAQAIRISIGIGSLVSARLQAFNKTDIDVTYDVYPGSVAVQSPEFSF